LIEVSEGFEQALLGKDRTIERLKESLSDKTEKVKEL